MNIVMGFLKSPSRCVQNQKSVQVFLTVGLLMGVLGTLFSDLARAKDIRISLVPGKGDGGDYHAQETGHWIVDSDIANPISRTAEY